MNKTKSVVCYKNIKNIERNDTCKFCDKLLPNDKDDINKHMKLNHNELIFYCELCTDYQPRNNLLNHMSQHACEIYNIPTNHIDISLSNIKNQTENKLQCSKCTKIFSSLSGLRYHKISAHSQRKIFKCFDCGSSFANKRILMNHTISIHSTLKPFECDICKKQFKTDSTLYTHKKLHSDFMPFTCKICPNKRFKLKHYLDTHMIRHMTEKKFKCNICKKSFLCKNYLTKHQKIHNTTENFGCNICGITLKQKRYLKEHLKKVHMK